MSSKKLIVILGPTASGKTALSIKLAKKINGEIVSADSRQVYQGMDIGTAKISKKDMKGIPHYLLDVAPPKRKFSVAQYQKLALETINKILTKRVPRVPFLVGGSPFYIYSVVEGWVFPQLKADQKLRKKLEKKSIEKLFDILKKLDSKRAAQIEKKNKRRLVRAIEIAEKLGKVPPLKREPQFNCLLIGIKKPKEELKELIKKRFSEWLKRGFVEEVRKLKKSGLSWKKIEEFGLHYRCVTQYLQGKMKYNEMVEKSLKELEKFSKRQMTWFKKDKRINWLRNYQEVEKLVRKFLK